VSSGNFELAQVKKLGYGSIAGIKMRVQVRATLWKYNPEIFSSIRYLMAKFLFPSGWNLSLDFKGKAKIVKRLERVSDGNLGDSRSLGEGVWEFRIDFGPGYRVYFGQIETTIVLLLCGPDKSTQEQDISTAKKYWREYRSRENA
jgi:putative addiction module killer protein